MKNETRDEIERLLAQLRERLDDVITKDSKFDNDYYLYRWLIHHGKDVERVNKRIRESIEWRKEVNTDDLAHQDWAYWAPGLRNDLRIGITGGTTKRGQPISFSNGDDLDVRALVQKYSKESLLRYYFQMFAKLEKSMLEQYRHGPCSDDEIFGNGGNNSTKGGNFKPRYNSNWYSAAPIHLISYKNFSLWNATCLEGIQVILEGTKIGMTHFPAAISEVHFVNLNRFSNMVVKVVKPLLNTQSFSLDFFGTDEAKWTKSLLEFIDEDDLPLEFGGGTIRQKKSNKA